MTKSLRLVLLACAGFLGLAFAAPALAAYGPSLTIEQSRYKLGAAITADTFIFAPKDDDPTAKLTISAPAGYGVNLSQAPGTKIGRVAAVVKANALAGALLALSGDVVVANGTDPAIIAASQQCTQRPANLATWVLNASLQGQTVQIPVFVNKLPAGPSSATLEVCLPPPQTATLGAQLVAADFTTTGVFTNPSVKSGYDWSGIFTPYVTGGTIPNPAQTVEWRTYVALPSSLSFKRVKSRIGLKFAGALRIAGVNTKGIRLRLYAGKKPNPAPNATSDGTGKLVMRTAKLTSGGRYSIKRPSVRVKTYFQMRFEFYVLKGECTPSAAPQGCKGEDIAAVTSSQVRVLPRHR